MLVTGTLLTINNDNYEGQLFVRITPSPVYIYIDMSARYPHLSTVALAHKRHFN